MRIGKYCGILAAAGAAAFTFSGMAHSIEPNAFAFVQNQ